MSSSLSFIHGRLKKEAKDFEECIFGETVYVWAFPKDDDPLVWYGFLKGPQDTVYEGGIFEIEILIGDNYPFEAPKMRFKTKVWHPNVSSQTGAICLDVLKDQWTPALCIRTLLVSIQALLSVPVPKDPQDYVVALQMDTNYDMYCTIARQWVQKYAIIEKSTLETYIQATMARKGIERSDAIAFLDKNKWKLS